jgi:hypothetical protein
MEALSYCVTFLKVPIDGRSFKQPTDFHSSRDHNELLDTLYSSVISHFLLLMSFLLLLPLQYSFTLFIILLFNAFLLHSSSNKGIFYDFCWLHSSGIMSSCESLRSCLTQRNNREKAVKYSLKMRIFLYKEGVR